MALEQTKSPWYVIGPGSMGLLWASHLLMAGHSVILVDRSKHASATSKSTNIILLDSKGEKKQFDVEVKSAKDNFSIEKAIVAVKNHHVDEVLSAFSKHFDPQVRLVLIQNGLGHEAVTRRRLPEAKVYLASVTHGAYSPHRYEVEHRGLGNVDIGPSDQAACQNEIADLLSLKALNIRWRENISEYLWRKVIINLCINPLTAILDCDNGELAQHEATKILIENLCKEGLKIANASGHQLDETEMLKTVTDVVSATAKNRSSMRQDINRGIKTENDAIGGFLLERARELGFEAPCIDTMFHLVQVQEAIRQKNRKS